MLYQNTPGVTVPVRRPPPNPTAPAESVPFTRYSESFASARARFSSLSNRYSIIFHLLTGLAMCCSVFASFLHFYDAATTEVKFAGLGVGLAGSVITSLLGAVPLKVASVQCQKGYVLVSRYLHSKASITAGELEALYEIPTPCAAHPLLYAGQ